MKKKNVKALMYSTRVKIINEIELCDRAAENELKSCYRDLNSYMYGYKRGLTEAAMIMLDVIYAKWPEEEDE